MTNTKDPKMPFCHRHGVFMWYDIHETKMQICYLIILLYYTNHKHTA